MHVGFLLPEYSHEKISTKCAGIGTSSRNIVLGLLKQKHKVSLFIYGQNNSEIIKEDDLTIYKIQKNKYPFLGFYLYREKINRYVNKIINSEKIEILEAADWTGITAFMNFKIPHVIRLHGSDTYFCHLEKRKQKWKNYFFEKMAFRNSKSVIGVSAYVLKISEELFKLEKRSTVIHNGIFIEKFSLPTEKIIQNTVLYFGSIIRKKGIFELAKIFNELIEINPKAKLMFLGRDVLDYKTNVSSLQIFKKLLSKKANLNFKYLGYVPYEKINRIVAKAQVCVFTSLAESFSMVTLEAMLQKKAIVSTNYPWAREIMINGRMGYLEDPKNHLSFAKKINHLMENHQLSKKMGENAHKHVLANFSGEILTNKNITFYKKHLKNEL